MTNASFSRGPLIGRLAMLLILGAIAGWMAAQTPANTPSRASTDAPPAAAPAAGSPTESRIRVQSNLVTAPVAVVDKAGNFVDDLKKSEVEIFDNGLPQTIQQFGLADGPIDLVILVQTNEAAAPMLSAVRPLGPLFSSLLMGSEGHAAVIFFDDTVRLVQPFSSDSNLLAKTLKSATPQGDKARLNDALMRAAAQLEGRPRQERRVVIALCEGFDRGSESKPGDVVRRVTGDQVAVYGIRLSPMRALLFRKDEQPPPNPIDTNLALPTPQELPHTISNGESVYESPLIPVIPILTESGDFIRSSLVRSVMQLYAGFSGGVFYSHGSIKDLQDELSQVALEINSQYVLTYMPTNLTEAGFHRLKVQVKRPAVKVRARAGYYYPSAYPAEKRLHRRPQG